MASLAIAWIFLLAAVQIGGCATTPPPLPTVTSLSPNGAASLSPYAEPTPDITRLARLWRERTQGGAISDFPIGPGDVLHIAVPGMKELEEQVVRVSGDGVISLPFIGVVQVTGLTEQELKEDLRRRLEKYMRNPPVSLFVREYRSRLVAVAGAVGKPGLYSLASGTETLLDVIAQAGGMTAEALPHILLIPAEAMRHEQDARLASNAPPPFALSDTTLALSSQQKVDPILIDLQNFTKGTDQLYLTLPARPGDSLIVPNGGEVIVGGWVAKPGSYKITPGLGVRGAVAAAGDLLFPADSSAVKIMRAGAQGAERFVVVDLAKIINGESPDILVQEGDVIEVQASSPKLVSYGVYNFFRVMFNFGAQLRP